jgi:hypothetical protein
LPTSRSKVWANQAACSGVIVVISCSLLLVAARSLG